MSLSEASTPRATGTGSNSSGSAPGRYTDALLDSLRQIADEPADRVIAEILEQERNQPTGTAVVDQLFWKLITNRDLVPSDLHPHARAFLTEGARLPEWARTPSVFASIKTGEDLFARLGPAFVVALYFKALPDCYGCWRGAEVLLRTGRMTLDPSVTGRVRAATNGDAAHPGTSSENVGIEAATETGRVSHLARRIIETAQFIIDVMQPGGLSTEPTEFGNQGYGIRSTLKVRLIHAAIRHMLKNPAEFGTPAAPWDTATYGEPINQEDLLGTLMSFSTSSLNGLKLLGIDLTANEEESYFQCWIVIGHLLGIRPEYLPRDLNEGNELMAAILRRNVGMSPSNAGPALTEALLALADDMLPGNLFSAVPPAIIVHLTQHDGPADPKLVTVLGLRDHENPLERLCLSIIGFVAEEINKESHRSPKFARFVEEFSVALIQGMIFMFNHGKRAAFVIPDSLRQSWNLDERWRLGRTGTTGTNGTSATTPGGIVGILVRVLRAILQLLGSPKEENRSTATTPGRP